MEDKVPGYNCWRSEKTSRLEMLLLVQERSYEKSEVVGL
jgi:hypothetical protein